MEFVPPLIEWYTQTPLNEVQTWVQQWFATEQQYFYQLALTLIQSQDSLTLQRLIDANAIDMNWRYDFRGNVNLDLLECELLSPLSYTDKIFQVLVTLPFSRDKNYLDTFFTGRKNSSQLKVMIDAGFAETAEQKETLRIGLYYLIAKGITLKYVSKFLDLVAERTDVGYVIFGYYQVSFASWKQRKISGGVEDDILLSAIKQNEIMEGKFLLTLPFPANSQYFEVALARGFYTFVDMLIEKYPDSIVDNDYFSDFLDNVGHQTHKGHALEIMRKLVFANPIENYEWVLITCIYSFREGLPILKERGYVLDKRVIKENDFMPDTMEALQAAYKFADLPMTLLDFCIQFELYSNLEPFPGEVTIFNDLTLFYYMHINDLESFSRILNEDDIAVSTELLTLSFEKEAFLDILLTKDINVNPLDPREKNRIVSFALAANPSVLRKMIAQRIDINNKFGSYYPLEYCVYNNLYESAKILIENGVEVDVLIGEYLDPLILVAAGNNKLDFVELMVPFTRYINRRDSNELNLMIYLMRSEQEHYSLLQKLVERGVDVDSERQPQAGEFDNVAIQAISRGWLQSAKLLISKTANVNGLLDVTIRWVIKTQGELLIELLKRGDVNLVEEFTWNERQVPVIIYAASFKNINCVEILAKAGCDINVVIDGFPAGQGTVLSFFNEPENIERILQLGFNAIWNYITPTGAITPITAGICGAIYNHEELELLAIKYLPEQINFVSSERDHLTLTRSVRATKALLRTGVDLSVVYDGLFNALDIQLMNKVNVEIPLLLLEAGLRPTIAEYDVEPTFYEALAFWQSSVEDRKRYTDDQVGRFCPIARDTILLQNVTARLRLSNIHIAPELVNLIRDQM